MNDQGGGQYRCMQPASIMRKHGYAISQVHPNVINLEVLQVLDPDVVVFQLFQTDQQIERIKRYRKVLPKAHFVYEIDDMFWAVPEGSFHKINPLLPRSKSQIRTAAKLCDTITVTTPELQKEMRALTSMRDVRVVPNHIPQMFVNAALAGRRSSEAIKSDKPRVGWAGGIGHGGDLKLIADVMAILGDQVQWVFLGMVPGGVDNSLVEAHSGVPFAEYPHLLGTLNLDLALAPLEENDFNRCKSDLRILEYAAAGFPVLASYVPAYDAVPVTRLQNRPELWAEQIMHLVKHQEANNAYADRLHEFVLSQRLMENHIAAHVKALLSKHSAPFAPMGSTQAIGKVVTVNARIDGLEHYTSVSEAWKAAPGADILYVRPGTLLTQSQTARIIQALGTHASAAPISNDGMYPTFGKFTRLGGAAAHDIDTAAALTNAAPILAPFPAGPCVILAGSALAKFGLPDEERFGNVEYAMADWGSRCCEGGRTHITVADTFVYTENQLQQFVNKARETLEHISMWTPGFVQLLQSYQTGDPLASTMENLDLAYNWLTHRGPPVPSYDEWARMFSSVTPADVEVMQVDAESWVLEDKQPTHFCIIMPTFNTTARFLKAALDSVVSQAYQNWTLIVVDDASANQEEIAQIVADYHDDRIYLYRREENGHICKASNDGLRAATTLFSKPDSWVVFLDHDDELAPHALYMVAREIKDHPDAKFIYSDADKLSPDGEFLDPYFAPGFSYELLLAQNYVTHLSAYRLDAVHRLGGFREGYEGSQDWDLTLRYLEVECGTPPDTKLIRHIPDVLYHWRQTESSTAKDIMNKPYAIEAGRKAVMDHLHRTKQAAFIGPNPAIPIFNMVRFLVPEQAPKVTIIIPTKDNDNIDKCVSDLMASTLYSNFDVIVMDNGSTKREARIKLTALQKVTNIKIIQWNRQFNFADLNNYAATQTDAKFICLMNDDIEVIERNWLNDMVGLASRPMVGAVGAKLIYKDDTVQCGGIMFSADQPPGLSSLHLWQKMGMHGLGQAGRAVITQPVIAVTGACMVIDRQLYLDMGGLDEEFPVDYNDVDFCLRLHKKGYRNIIAAQSFMRHLEGETKKRTKTWNVEQMLQAETRLLVRHAEVIDPYVNPNLEFHPSQTTLVQFPAPKPWQPANRARMLIINGTEQEAKEAYRLGYIPFCASLEGHYLMFTLPSMHNVRAIDLRQDETWLEHVLRRLEIARISFCGIGDGTLASVGFLTNLAMRGWQISYTPSDRVRNENDHEYYDPHGWVATWNRFFNAIQHEDVQVAAE